ncbi:MULTISPECIES: hypothetical protein [unclassified Nocardioides]|uniref:hypothetical protein n=1 Tax=unclassified Nocardioides TaxID=2615069 RepID=UPI0009EFCD06|nr:MULTISPECIES: hypothetical protein [unclassified Nocardioides]GAW50899.1 uncharacterized protein (Precursor) [Nocardioides sp. PD653-B2]GAW54057.1 uncharacterized protein (Precursor) [Nocardioides sp. PD653]
MRTYRAAWTWTLALLVTVSAVAGWVGVGAAPLLGAVVTLTCLGVVFGLTWTEPMEHRLRLSLTCGGWFAVVAVLIVGLPALLDVWALLVLVAVGAGTPVLVEAALSTVPSRRPVRPVDRAECLSDRDLARRWRTSQDEIRRRGCPPATVLRLVQERAQLLDEIQRRDPGGFDAWARRAVAREPQER